MEQFYDERFLRYIFPTINDVFEHQNEIFMFIEEHLGYGLHADIKGNWILCPIQVVHITKNCNLQF